MAFTTASLFFFCRSVRNWVPRRQTIVGVKGIRGPPFSCSNASFAGRGLNGFKRLMETVCGWPGASSESMVTTFWAAPEASVIRKGPMEWGWILLALHKLVRRTRSLTAKSRFQALQSKYSLLMAAAVSKLALIVSCILSCAC
uniref:Secreted protein n=1 Tax=Romanomermis culicivorax TaxID=13658 RepID=A0A915I8E4_ROMCU